MEGTGRRGDHFRLQTATSKQRRSLRTAVTLHEFFAGIAYSMRPSPCTVAPSLCFSRNARKGRMVMDRFEVLGFDHVIRDTAIAIERQRNVAHQILDELGIVISALGDVFFIGALEQSIDFA